MRKQPTGKLQRTSRQNRITIAPVYPRKRVYTRRELEHFKTILLGKREEALNHLREYRDSAAVVDVGKTSAGTHHHAVSFLDRSIDAVNREETAAMMNRQARFLGNIDDALKRIEEGTYGMCIGCHKLITKERLEAVPHTRQCITCKGGGTMVAGRATHAYVS